MSVHDMRFAIDGMSCAACAARADKALRAIPGIGAATVNFASATEQVSFGKASQTDLRASLQRAGYPAREVTLTPDIDAMHCASCVGKVEKALAHLSGVVAAHVNHAVQKAHVTLLEGALDAGDLIAAVRKAGLTAR